MERSIVYYQTSSGKSPARDWLFYGSLQKSVRNIILERLHRLSFGNPGLSRYLGNGVYELKIDFGPGYRIYFSYVGKEMILLLCGGDKSSQKKDIALALKYWKDFNLRS